MSPRRLQAGFSLLELIVVVVLVILLFSVAAMRLLPLRGEAEKVHVLRVHGSVQAALALQLSERVLRGKLDGIDELARENPLAWLSHAPPQAPGSGCAALAAGHWGWCEANRTLRYQLRYPQYFENLSESASVLRFRVAVDRDNGQLKRVAFEALDGLPVLREDIINGRSE
ncbi:MAG: hypothetical protein R3217_06790 [Gammaproteobacteria bacterium]|nr:hypothetical protein [Gammaproteobacteria bacterium]